MTLVSRALQQLFGLPPAQTDDVMVDRALVVPMPDGVSLLADHYYPPSGERLPTILLRSPYGRAGVWGELFARPYAERGFQVLIQSARGTGGSGGELNPFHQERADGLASVAWLKQQPWFSGVLATTGPSYLGLTQWAIASELGSELQAMSTWNTSAEFRSSTYTGESFWLESALGWTVSTTRGQSKNGSLLDSVLGLFRADAPLEVGLRHLPLRDADEVVLGQRVDFWRDWLEHNAPGDPWWKTADFSGSVAETSAPNHLIGGWYDIFLPQTLRDFRSLRDAGRQPYLTIGAWAHRDILTSGPVMLRESLDWFRAHLLGDPSGLRRSPVRLFVQGANEWRDLPDWPPAGAVSERWHLLPGGGLGPSEPVDSPPDHYRYDPANPTQNVGGAALGKVAGPMDNRALEARPDVLIYSSEPLSADLEVMGAVTAELYVRSSLDHTDFFARLCDVDGSGRSLNVSDSLVRLRPGWQTGSEGGSLVRIELWPTAYRFKRGHRLRLQVSSGAFPRWARNPGSGEPLALEHQLLSADQTVFHDPAHPSAVVLTLQP